MRSLFVIHASLWDVVVLVLVAGFGLLYFIIWSPGALFRGKK